MDPQEGSITVEIEVDEDEIQRPTGIEVTEDEIQSNSGNCYTL